MIKVKDRRFMKETIFSMDSFLFMTIFQHLAGAMITPGDYCEHSIVNSTVI